MNLTNTLSFLGSSLLTSTVLILSVRAQSLPNVSTQNDLFPTFADEQTVVLWLFDESDYPHTTLTDASKYEKADLCLMEGGSLVAGKFGRALKVSNGYAVSYAGFTGSVTENHLRESDGVPSGLWGLTEGPGALLNGLAGQAWTIELWLNLLTTGTEISIIDLGQAYEPGLSLVLDGDSLKLFNYYAGVKGVCRATLSLNQWYHIAIVRDSLRVECFIDGIDQGGANVSQILLQTLPDLQKPSDREHEHRGFMSMSFEQRRQNRFNVAIGSDRHGAHVMQGLVDEIRISNAARYSGNFTPQTFSRNCGNSALKPSVANGPPLLFAANWDTGGAINLSSRKHVFIDDVILETKSNAKLVINKPYGRQAISGFVVGHSAWRPSVYDVNGQIDMAIPDGAGSTYGTVRLATSSDGIHFAMQDPIITETPMYGAFFEDLNPNINLEEKYKANAFVGNRGMYFYVSPDGQHWRRNETIQLPLKSGGCGECYWDDQRGEYASYIKRDASFNDLHSVCSHTNGRVATGFWTDQILQAWPFNHMASPYFEGDPYPAVTCEGPISFNVTGAGQVYRTRVIKYPWAPDVYLAFVWRYPGNDKARHVDLGVSRDGENWKFFATSYPVGPWYIPYGSAQEELSMYGLIRRGNEIWQYVDEGGAHGGSAPRHYYRYRQRLDGFVSIDATNEIGYMTTRPLIFEGNRLELNVTADSGFVRVELLDEKGLPIPGFTLDECDSIRTDTVRQTVTWNGKSGVTGLVGRVVRLRFQMKNSKLFAFQFNDDKVNGIRQRETIENKSSLFQNHPNPFNPTTVLGYQIAPSNSSDRKSSVYVMLSVFDLLGRQVASLVDEEKSPGNYELKFDASTLSSGVYFYKIQAGEFIQTKKMIFLK